MRWFVLRFALKGQPLRRSAVVRLAMRLGL
jgi:hypothetical protein